MEVKELIINYERILEDKILFLEYYNTNQSLEYNRISSEIRIFKMIIEDLKKTK